MIDFTEGSQMRTNASGSPKTEKPNIIPHGQEKKMLDEKGHIQCEIEELKIEMQKHIDALKNCTKLVEKNNEKLKKLKMEKENNSTEMTVEELQSKNWYVNMREFIYPKLEVIDENTVRIEGVEYKKVEKPKPSTLLDIIRDWNDDEDDPPCEVLVDMISDWLPDKFQSYQGYGEGWNDCLDEIKENLK